MDADDMNTPQPGPDVLLANLDWARRLARSLVRDEAGADDLVQEAWLRTRSGSGRDRPTGTRDSRRWLGRVLANLARDARRSARRREQREAMAARADVRVSDEDLAGRVHRQETLGRWVLELDEPYRRTMLLRWFDGLSAVDIAAAEGLPAATVRTRLRRGAALLRARAERESSGNGRAWLAGLAGIPLEPAPAAPLPSTALAAGLLAMNVKTLIVLLAALLGGATWLFLTLQSGVSQRETLPSPDVASVPAPAAEPLTAAVDSGEGRRAASATPLAEDSGGAPDDAASDRDLVVRVIGENGEPAIGTRVLVVRGRGEREREWLESVSEAPDGLARFEDYVGRLERAGYSKSVPKFTGLDVVGFDPPRVALPLSGLPAEPITLRVPQYGELVVRLVDQEGAPFVVTEHVEVTPLEDTGDPRQSLKRGNRASRFIKEASEARFPMVAPGARLWVQVRPSGVLADVKKVVEPLAAGERRVVQLVMGAKDAHVIGRFLAPDGTAVPLRSVDVEFSTGDSARVHDVGDVVMGGVPTIAAGRVVDEGGEPVERVAIALYEKINHREGTDEFDWSFAGVGYAYSDSSGRFDLKGQVAQGEYALRAFAHGLVDRGAQRFLSGTRGIEIVVDEDRQIAGRLSLPAGVDPARFEVRAQEEGASRERRAYASWSAGVGADGRFVLDGLRPEAVTLLLYSTEIREALARLDQVLPCAGGDGLDPALDPWDLSSELEPLTFDVRLANGSPMVEGYVAIGSTVIEHHRGKVDTVVPTRRGDQLRVFAPGHVPALVPMGPGLDRVDLQRGPPVVVSIEAPLPDPPEGVVVELCLVPEDAAWALPRSATRVHRSASDFGSNFGSDFVRCRPGETSWTLHGAGAGRYRPRWRVFVPSDDVLVGAMVSIFTTSTGRYEIDLEPGRETPGYGATIDLEDWKHALSQVRQGR